MGESVGVGTGTDADDEVTSTIPQERWMAVGATAIVAVAVVVTAWHDSRSWIPTTDWALIELRVRGVGTSIPLLGAPAANGFHHPGPLPYLLLAPFYRLFGSDPHALLVSVAVVNAGAVAGIAWTAWRRGRLPLVALTLAAVVWLAGSLPAGFLRDPWNPWLAVLPFAWFVLLIWSVVVDDLVALPIAALVGSYVVQAHIGYVPEVVVLFSAAVGVVGWRAWRRRTVGEAKASDRTSAKPRLMASLAVTGLALVVAWALPALQQVTNHPGNVVLIERSFTGDTVGPHLTMSDTGRVAAELGPTSPWLGFAEPVDGIAATVIPGGLLGLLFPIAVLAVGFVLSINNRTARAFVVTMMIANVAGLLALSRLEQQRVFPYVLRFTWVIAAFTVLAAIWAVVARDERPHAPRAVSAVGLALVAVGLVRFVVLDGSAVVPVYHPEQHEAEQGCVAQLLPAVQADAAGHQVQITTTEFWPIFAAPLLNELDRTGARPSIDDHLKFYADGVPTDLPSDRTYVVVDQNEKPDWRPDPGMVQIATCDGLTPAERADVTAITAKTDRTTADGIRLIDLAPRNVRAAVYRLP